MNKTIGYDNGRAINFYVRVVGILSKDLKKTYDKYDIITGNGDKNSKVLIKATLEFDKDFNKIDPEKLTKNFIDCVKREYNYDQSENTLLFNPHDVYKIDMNWEINDIDSRIRELQEKKNFLLENQRRVYVIKEAFK